MSLGLLSDGRFGLANIGYDGCCRGRHRDFSRFKAVRNDFLGEMAYSVGGSRSAPLV